MPTQQVNLFSGALPVVIVIAVSALAMAAMAAWLVHDVARKAIDKTTPEGVAQVVGALADLLSPLQSYLPWSNRRTAGKSGVIRPPSGNDENNPCLSEEVDHEA
jgi:hypothetical protein